MPLLQPPSPVLPPWRPGRRLGAAWGAGAGVAGLLALAAAGQAQPLPALLAAGAVGLTGLYLSQRAARVETALEPPPAAAQSVVPISPPGADRAAPLTVAVEALEDPLIIVAAQEPDDLIARRIAYANAAARDLLRIPQEGALLVKALRYPEVLSAVERSLFRGEMSSAAYETGGAQSRAWRAWSAPLESEAAAGGPVRYAVLTLRDETDVRRNQRMNADFLANASHELRTPLASLTGFIETLRGHARDDPAARERFLGIMAAQAERMGRLIFDLLSLSRIELNEHVPPSGEADLAGVARDVADALSPQARARGVTRSSRRPPGRRRSRVIATRFCRWCRTCSTTR
jgi:two-component system phosphate regulon sensor histidine kinase PhoR